MNDFIQFSSAMMTDIMTGAVKPEHANAVSSHGRKLLKGAEMAQRYSAQSTAPQKPPPMLLVTSDE